MKTYHNAICLLLLIFGLSACSNDLEYGISDTYAEINDLEYDISGTYAEINEMQILDPMAPENNAGVVNSLEGNVANKIMKGYQTSTYSPKEGRSAVAFEGME